MKPIPILLAVSALILSGCTGINVMTSGGMTNTNPAREYAHGYYTIYRGGGIIHMNTAAGQITGQPTTKKGEACSHSVLWLVAFGDSSIEAAKEAGQITKVGAIDHQVLGVLGFVYHRHCTVVSGT